ncbi:MAG: CoA ester lyase [Thermodesulfobacteriota bacterium]|nr:CoA ester lyase [Thermodesulfobacteriota bacterium]
MEMNWGSARRTILLTPAVDEGKVRKACGLDVDAIMLDLEDSIVPAKKKEAREAAAHLLGKLSFGHRERMVRINGVQTDFWLEDLRAVLPLNLGGLMVPKVESAREVLLLEDRMDELEAELGIREKTPVIVTVETAAGLIVVEPILQASRRVQGVFLGSGDYAVSTGIRITRESLLYPRSRIAVAAAQRGIQAIDAAYFQDVRDEKAVREDALAARDLGFTGKIIFHPLQAGPVNEVFTPSPAEVERAQKIMAAYEKAAKEGVGVFLVDNDFVAIDIVHMARRILARANKISQVKKSLSG